jgi:hypothetical protein
LGEAEAGALFNYLVQMGNLTFQISDDLSGFFFFFFGLFDQSPGFVYLFLEHADSKTIFVSQLYCSFNSGRV